MGTHLFAFEPPTQDEFYTVLIVPAILVFFAVTIYYIAFQREQSGGRAPWKWAALAPLLLAAYLGFQSTSNIMDPMYREIAHGKKMMFSHVGALALPLLALVAIVLWEYFSSRQRARAF
jgi:ascorbate-specific PTS system EIIC-type component UlaA